MNENQKLQEQFRRAMATEDVREVASQAKVNPCTVYNFLSGRTTRPALALREYAKALIKEKLND